MGNVEFCDARSSILHANGSLTKDQITAGIPVVDTLNKSGDATVVRLTLFSGQSIAAECNAHRRDGLCPFDGQNFVKKPDECINSQTNKTCNAMSQNTQDIPFEEVVGAVQAANLKDIEVSYYADHKRAIVSDARCIALKEDGSCPFGNQTLFRRPRNCPVSNDVEVTPAPSQT